MDLDEWEKSLKSLGSAPFWVTVSGGEPFLFQEIDTFCEMVHHYCRPALINIPTNGILATIPEKVQRIAELCRDSTIIINLSLDGIGAKHDAIRGVKGNFEKFERTLGALLALRNKITNLQVGIHSVISVFNIDDLDELIVYVDRVSPDQFITEMAEERIELGTIGLPISPDRERYSRSLDRLITHLEAHSYRKVSRLTSAFRIEYYHLVKRVLEKQKQIIPCFAGWSSAQIFADGTVWPCCVRGDPLGNLREVGYDFSKIWFGNQSKIVRRSIANRECFCPLANAAYTNMLQHIPTLFKVSRHLVASAVKDPVSER